MDNSGFYLITGGFFNVFFSTSTFSPSCGFIDMDLGEGVLSDKYGDSLLLDINFERNNVFSGIWTEKLSLKKKYKNLDNEKIILYDLFTNDLDIENQEWYGEWISLSDNEKGKLVFQINYINDSDFFNYRRVAEKFEELTNGIEVKKAHW